MGFIRTAMRKVLDAAGIGPADVASDALWHTAVAGDAVSGVVNLTDGTDDGANFESVITVADQIQQSSALDLSTKKFSVVIIAKGT